MCEITCNDDPVSLKEKELCNQPLQVCFVYCIRNRNSRLAEMTGFTKMDVGQY